MILAMSARVVHLYKSGPGIHYLYPAITATEIKDKGRSIKRLLFDAIWIRTA